MAGTAGRGSGAGRSSGVISSVQSMEALTEWRSSGQVENSIPSTSPPYWDMDDEDNGGPKPSELYGMFTWKIENFSQISKRELRSNIFEVGGYKWYILIYPQGCDVCNHLSLFLCVANHDKLSPGWKHFAQFTIAVVNKDPKKSKYSDTLHRFGKKEHDWGWKKFMELSKVLDGFIVSDILVIKAQVQVISEKEARPFRCLDCQYRRELVRVYLTNVEKICRSSLEEGRDRLLKLIEDTARWPRFCEFWLEVDNDSRHSMYREKSDVIFKAVVKKFFIEKEVTSTLVMDTLYSGLKALECQSNSKKGKAKSLDTGESPSPIVRLEKDMFVLADDVLLLIQRAAREPLPPQDEKGPQNRTKDGSSGEDVDKDSMERDETRLTELGRRTVEIFVLEHIFSNNIEVAYEEAAALKMQEELIREEEVAGQADCDKKTKRVATEKEKRAKKKQSKHRRNSRKGKDKGKDDKLDATVEYKQHGDASNDDIPLVDAAITPVQSVSDKRDTGNDVSDVSDTGDDVSETLQLESEDQDICTVNWDTDTSEVRLTETSGSGISGLPLQNGQEEKKSTYIMDDSSSTCVTNSVPSEVMNGLRKGNKIRASPTRGKNQRGKETEKYTIGRACEFDKQPSEPVAVAGRQYDTSQSCTATGPESEAVLSLKDQIKWLQQNLVKKEEEVVTLQKKLNKKDKVDVARPSKQNLAAEGLPIPSSPSKNPPSSVQPKVVSNQAVTEPVSIREKSSTRPQKVEKATSITTSSPQVSSIPKKDVQNPTNPSNPTIRHTIKTTDHQAVAVSRPSSAPLVPAPRPSAPVVSTVQTAPSLARSVSAAGRLANVSQSYKNAIIGGGPVDFTPSMGNPFPICSPPPYMGSLPMPMLSPQSSTSSDQGSGRPGFTFGSAVSQEVLLQNQPSPGTRAGYRMHFADEPSGSSRQAEGMSSAEDFPHLDIINYLLDEEQNMGRDDAKPSAVFHNGHHHPLNRQYTFPGNMDMGYHGDAMDRVYGASFDVRRGVLPQAGLSPYGNGQFEGGLQSQWPMSAGHVSMLNMRTTEGDGYRYQLPEYANIASGINGYSVYRPASGL